MNQNRRQDGAENFDQPAAQDPSKGSTPYHALLKPSSNCQLTLAPHGMPALVYNITGLAEFSIGTLGQITFRTFSLVGIIADEHREGAPARIQLAPALGTTPAGTFNPELGHAVISASLALTYPELINDPAQVTYPGGDVGSLLVPLPVLCSLSIAFNARTLAFNATGRGEVKKLPPVREDPVDLDFDLNCDVSPAYMNKCLQVWIWIKVLKDGAAKNLPDKAAVEKMMKKVEEIWSCPGQCCVQVKMDYAHDKENPTFDPDLPKKLGKDNKKDLKDLWDGDWPGSKMPHAIKVAFVDELDFSFGGSGVSLDGGVVIAMQTRNFTSDKMEDRTTDDMGETLAHELGHAMGLAPDMNNDDPNGVTGHSTDGENLMGGGWKDGKRVPRTKLNQKQCDVVRNHQFNLSQTTEDGCTCKPLEQTT